MVNQTLKGYLKNFKLSEEQETRVLDTADNLLNMQNKHFTQKSLMQEMKESYNKKSLKQLKYFLFNISQSHNGHTGEFYSKNWSNGLFAFENSFSYTENDNGKLSVFVNEKQEGAYLKQQDKLYGYKVFAKVKYLDWHMVISEYLNTKNRNT